MEIKRAAQACAAAVIVWCVVAPALSAQSESLPAMEGSGVGDTLVLSLIGAQRRALQQNPAFLADRQETAIARGELRQARVYPFNPELAADAPGVVTNGAVGEYEISLTQEVEWAGQRGLRIGAAEFGLNRAASSVRNAALATVAEVSLAFADALSADRRLAVSTAVLELNERLLAATRTRLREGEISVLEANLVEIEYGRARARVLAARRGATSATLQLKRIAGIAVDQPIRLADELPDAPDPSTLTADNLVTLALARRPDLAASTAAVHQLETLRRLAGRKAIPNLRLGIIAGRDGRGEESRLGIGVGFSLPLWDRNQGLRAEWAARIEQARLQRRAVELRIRTEVAGAYRAYIAASEEAQVYETSVLQPARANQKLLETAYRAGKVNLPTLLLLRNQLLDAELGYWNAWLDRSTALFALQAATATLVPDGDLPTYNIETDQ